MDNNSSLVAGRSTCTGADKTGWLNGQLDEIKLYNRALSNVVETPGPDIWGGYSAAPDVSGARRYRAVLGSWVQQGEGAQDGHVIANRVGLGGANGDDQPHDELFQNGSEVFDLQAADYAYFFDMTHDLHNPKVWCQPKATNHAIRDWILLQIKRYFLDDFLLLSYRQMD